MENYTNTNLVFVDLRKKMWKNSIPTSFHHLHLIFNYRILATTLLFCKLNKLD